MGNLTQAELVSTRQKDLKLLGVKANGAVKGRLLVMSLEQRYRNASKQNTEISYTFPLPFGSVLMAVEVDLNGKVLTGEVSPKGVARERYEEALSEGNTSIMLEKNPDGSYTLELGNLMAREECKIMVRYSQVLATEHGQVRLMLPTTIAPRYGNAITQGKLQPHQTTVTDLAAEYPFDITLTLYGDMAYASVGSPSHKTTYARHKSDLVISLSQRGTLDRDFILVINNLKNASDALACKDLYEEGQHAVMAFFSPRIESAAPKVMTAKVLVDCSGSMTGDSIEAARSALKGIIGELAKEDKFSLSKFGNTVEHRSRGMWSGTAQAKASAMRWIDNVDANLGGTEMAQALVSTIAIANGGQSDLLLITDGEIEGIDEVIAVAQKSTHRVFIVAIGASPAEVHLKRLASATGGHCDFVAPGEDVEPAVLRMSARMRAARATDIRVEWPASLALRWQQQVQSYAFEDDAINVCAFVDSPADEAEFTMVKLWGRVEGQAGEVLMGEAPLSLTASSTNILARLTANAKYLELVHERAKRGAPAALGLAQSLAVTYKLVTDETNFILVHERSEEEKALEMPDAHKVPQMLAAGWGGAGSVVRADRATKIGARMMADSAVMQPHYASMGAPAVWRGRRPAASAHMDEFDGCDMDDYEVPAFLRKKVDDEVPVLSETTRRGIDKLNALYWIQREQSPSARKPSAKDFGYTGITPAGIVRWLSINHPALWPKTYAGLQDLGLGLAICEWLEFEIGKDSTEDIVVSTFLSVMVELVLPGSAGFKGAVAAIQKTLFSKKEIPIVGPIPAAIRDGFKGITAKSWPDAIANFPESEAA